MKDIRIFEQYTDLEIIQKVLHGELALFEILIRRNNPGLYKTGRSYGYSHDNTLDLMQDTFIDAFSGLSKFEHRSTFKTWIIKIMLNNCYRRKQKFSVRNEIPADVDDRSIPLFSDNQGTDVNKTMVNKELQRVIEHALENVPLEYRMVFSLREISGFNVLETADALNISEENVKVRLHRAKAMLRKEIEKSYTAEDIFEFNLIYCDDIVSRVMKKIQETMQ